MSFIYRNTTNHMTSLLQNEALSSSSSSSPVLESLCWRNTSDPTFHGVGGGNGISMVCFDNVRRNDAMVGPFFQHLIKDETTVCNGGGDEDCDDDDYVQHQLEKKRRLSADKVEYLERSFKVENRLEPERKVQLAKEVGLQPKQVAIWFQNRRARFKTKQLEKDYVSLKARYGSLKADYDKLLKEKHNLTSEVLSLTDKLQLGEREKGHQSEEEPQEPISSSRGDLADNPIPKKGSVMICNQEDAITSAISDVLDCDSPHFNANGNHHRQNQIKMLDPTTDSSHHHYHGFEPEYSDFSQDEEDDLLSQSLLPPLLPYCPKLEIVDYNVCHDTIIPAENPCNFGFTVDDQPFRFWPC